jgi:hypothetical protein
MRPQVHRFADFADRASRQVTFPIGPVLNFAIRSGITMLAPMALQV